MIRDGAPPSQERPRGASLGLPGDGPGSLAAFSTRIGAFLIDSIGVLDRPVIVAYLLVIVTFFIAINLAVDVLYSALDPRVRLTESKG